MPEREIIVIPATTNAAKTIESRQLKVAAYCRVSSDSDEQMNSVYAQQRHYTDMILRNQNWRMAGIYADEGISGARAENRPAFQKLLRHCKRGNIDLILTKSVSRFARNTLDSIGYVRQLKAMGVGVFFEKEGINTLEESSELLLTLLSSFAQEELASLSKNVKMGIRVAMREGKVNFQYKRLYGYQKGADGKPEVLPQQAEVVRRIFADYLAGQPVARIAQKLNEEQIQSPSSGKVWSVSTLQGMLQNEKYCGDVLLQKTYVTDPISKKVRKNNGELPKVYIKNNHPAIVTREIFERAQAEHGRRSSKRKVAKGCVTEQGKYSGKYALSEILLCGHCLTPYRRTVWTRRDGEKQPVWRCIKRLDYGNKYCAEAVTLDEISLKQAVVAALRATHGERQALLPTLQESLRQTLQGKGVGRFVPQQAEQRIAQLKEETMKLIQTSLSATAVTDVTENEERFKAMSDEILALQEQLTTYYATMQDTPLDHRLHEMMLTLEQEVEHGTYQDHLVRQLISSIRVTGEDTLQFTFRCGLVHEQRINAGVKKTKRI